MSAPAEMLSVAEARAAILEQFTTLDSESVALLDALDRVLAEPVEADINLPPFANSSMDGYAVRAADLVGAKKASPEPLAAITTLLRADPKLKPEGVKALEAIIRAAYEHEANRKK